MDLKLNEKKVIITASTDGIGLAIAKLFLEEGAYVLINGRDKEKGILQLEHLQNEFGSEKVFLYSGDATKGDDINSLCQFAKEKLGNINCIVANVGSGKAIGKKQLDLEMWKHSFDINLYSAIQLLDKCDSLWDEQKGGSIVLVSSLVAHNRIQAPYAYAAAKGGISILCKYLADDYARRKIRVNSVAPGNVYYPGGRWEELMNEDPQGTEEYISQSVPLKRFAAPEEIANAVVFLSSDRASFITGASLIVDGGQSRKIY